MIGLFNDSFLPILDGVNITVYNYAYWLHQAGIEVCVVTPENPNQVDASYPFEVLRYTSIPVPGRKPYRYGLDFFAPFFKNRLQQMDFTLIHAHSPFSTGRMGRELAKSKGIPFVASFHSKYREDFQKAIPIQSDLILDQIVKQIANFFSSADEVWIPQPTVLETLRSYGYQGEAFVMEHGNDLADRTDQASLRKAMRTHLGVQERETMLLFVGQQVKQKNIPLIIEALSQLEDLPYRMYSVGIGIDMEMLQAQVQSRGLSDRFTFVGSISSRDELAGYYAAADLFLFPSTYDTSGIVVREAAAMGTPSLLVSGSHAACQVIDGVSGFLSPEVASSYADKIRRIITHPCELQEVSHTAQQRLARSWQTVSQEVLQRYSILINQYKHAKR